MDKKLPHPAWSGWHINRRGELYHTQYADLVFTPKQLIGLHWHLQALAAERADLRDRLERLRATCTERSRDNNIVVFPRYTPKRRKS